jgi:hypothetical protein
MQGASLQNPSGGVHTYYVQKWAPVDVNINQSSENEELVHV